MSSSPLRVFVIAASLVWLCGCETTSLNTADGLKPETTGITGGETTGSIASGPPPNAEIVPASKALLGGDPNDDLNLAKRFFREGNYGLAERYFRRAAENGPRDAEAWLGLAASYDRLKRFELADRAYAQLLRLTGSTPEVLNNIGYSYMLRGDYTRAREKLLQAQAMDPGNQFVRTNLTLLEESQAKRKAIR